MIKSMLNFTALLMMFLSPQQGITGPHRKIFTSGSPVTYLAFVNSTNGTTSTSASVSLSGYTGDFAVVWCFGNSHNTTLSISDTTGNTFHADSFQSSFDATQLWSIVSLTGGSDTITCNQNAYASNGTYLNVTVYSKGGLTGTLDQAGSVATQSTETFTGSVSATSSGELVVCMVTTGAGGTNFSAPSTGYTLRENQGFFGYLDNLSSTSGTNTMSVTSGYSNGALQCATYK